MRGYAHCVKVFFIILVVCQGAQVFNQLQGKRLGVNSPPVVSREHGGQGEGMSWMREVIMLILDQVQQTDAKLAGWEARLLALENQVSEVKSNMALSENRVEDKLSNIKDKLEEGKTCGAPGYDIRTEEINQQLAKLSNTLTTAWNTDVENLRHNMNRDERDTLGKFANISSNLERSISLANSHLIVLANNISTTIGSVEPHLKKIAQEMEARFADLSEQLELVNTSLNAEDERLHEKVADQTAALELLSSNSASLHDLKWAMRPTSCSKGNFSIPYVVVYPNDESLLKKPYLCDTKTSGGGWILIQRRISGSVDFQRGWDEYKQGFGSIYNDFWLGLDNIYAITSSGIYELRIDLVYKSKTVYAHYSSFAIASEAEKYTLQLGSYNGTAGDSLDDQRWMPFSTFDRDNDKHTYNCASKYHRGGWWYSNCGLAGLNGLWKATDTYNGIAWYTLTGWTSSVTYSEMKVRLVREN